MSQSKACKSYRPDDQTGPCADGFLQRHTCRVGWGCGACGQPRAEYMPYCMWDELPPHFVDESGRPKFYKLAQQRGGM